MAILRIVTGDDGQSHFEAIEPTFEPLGDMSEQMLLPESGGIIIRRFDPRRSNNWHPAPGRVCVYTVSGAVEIEIGDGSVRRLQAGDILIAEDVQGQGHLTREVGDEPRLSIFVPLRD